MPKKNIKPMAHRLKFYAPFSLVQAWRDVKTLGRRRLHETNAWANVVMLLDAWRPRAFTLDSSTLTLLEHMHTSAHKGLLQLEAINMGTPLNSVEINARYAAGWRAIGATAVKLEPCVCGYEGFRRDRNGYCDQCNARDKARTTGGRP